MNLYELHSNPETLHDHEKAHNTVPDLILERLEFGKQLNIEQITSITKNAKLSYMYADTIKGEWPPGEEVIAASNRYAYLYAKYVIKGRWPPGEKVIAADTYYSNEYNKFLAQKP